MRWHRVLALAWLFFGCVTALPKENSSQSQMDAKLRTAAEAEVKRAGYDLRELKSRIEFSGSAWANNFFSESEHNDYIGRIRQNLGDQDYRAVVFSLKKPGLGGNAVVFLSPKDFKILAVYRGR